MNGQTIMADWQQIKGQIKEAFGKLTDDDVVAAEGHTEQIVGAIQRRHGYSLEQAQQAWDAFARRIGLSVEGEGEGEGKVENGIEDPVREAISPYDENLPHHDMKEALRIEVAREVARGARKDF